MAFSRAAAFRSSLRAARPVASRPQLWQQVARRSYASGHGSTKASGDAVWALGAVAVTVPACWYLLHNAPESSHGHDAHGDHGDSHGKAHHDTEVAAESKDEPEEEAEAADESEDKDSEKAEASDSDDAAKEADTPETSDDEGKGDEKEGDEKEAASESGDKDEPKEKAAASTDINGEEKGTKGEGTPETAKAKGTVDTKRPQA